MSAKTIQKTTTFPQKGVRRNFPKDYKRLERLLVSDDDASMLFALIDANCSSQPVVDIEWIRVNVFKGRKIVKPEITSDEMEDIEIRFDKELMKRLKESMRDDRREEAIPWEEVQKYA